MTAKELVEAINACAPDDCTEIDILLIDGGAVDFLNIRNIIRNVDCSGINSIGINVVFSGRLTLGE